DLPLVGELDDHVGALDPAVLVGAGELLAEVAVGGEAGDLGDAAELDLAVAPADLGAGEGAGEARGLGPELLAEFAGEADALVDLEELGLRLAEGLGDGPDEFLERPAALVEFGGPDLLALAEGLLGELEEALLRVLE